MNLFSALGALELGLLYGLVALGVYLTFRVLDFPDLTVDGSFPLGAATAASAIVLGVDAWTATLAAGLVGALAGLITGALSVTFRILNLLAGILVMVALYSVNLRVMGRPNVPLLGEATVFTAFAGTGLDPLWLQPLVVGLFAAAALAAVALFLRSEAGLALRAAGANPRMAQANGIAPSRAIFVGLALSNALVALAGALYAQSQGGADVSTGVGTIVVGLAAVIIGQAMSLGRRVGLFAALAACVAGSVAYRFAVAAALEADVVGLRAQDLNLVTAVLVAAVLALPRARVLFARPGRRARTAA